MELDVDQVRNIISLAFTGPYPVEKEAAVQAGLAQGLLSLSWSPFVVLKNVGD